MPVKVTRKGIEITPNAPLEFKRKVGKLLNDCMKNYDIKGEDKDSEKAFKEIFKSNLYYIIDNCFEPKAKED